MSVNDNFLEEYYELLEEDLRGPWIRGTDNMYEGAVKSPSKKKGLKKIAHELLLANENEAFTLESDLCDLGKNYTVIIPDGDSMFNAVLSCLEHPAEYTASVFRKHIVSFALHNIEWFKTKLITEGQSLESYLRNISCGLSYGDRNCLQIMAMLWKMRISVLNPFEEADHIWHGEGLEGAHVVLIWNGHNHYSGSINISSENAKLKPIRNTVHYKTKVTTLPNKLQARKAELQKIAEDLKTLNQPAIKNEPQSDDDSSKIDVNGNNVTVADVHASADLSHVSDVTDKTCNVTNVTGETHGSSSNVTGETSRFVFQ